MNRVETAESEQVDRLGLIFGALAALFWPFSLGYSSAQAANIVFNMLACAFLWRSAKTVALGFVCLFLTVTGLMFTLTSQGIDGVYDLVPLSLASGLSTFLLIAFFCSLGGQRTLEKDAELRPTSHRIVSLIPLDLVAMLLFTVAVAFMFLSCMFQLEPLFYFGSLPALYMMPAVFVYGVVRGVTKEFLRKDRQTGDPDSELPSL